MKPLWFRTLVALGSLLGLAPAGGAAGGPVPIVVDAPLSGPAVPALADLERALKSKGLLATRRDSLADAGPLAVVVGMAGSSKAVDRLLAAHQVALPREP